MLSLQVYTDSTMTRTLADYSGRAHLGGGSGFRFSTNGHGFGALNVPLVPMSLTEAFEVYEWPGTPHVVVSGQGGEVVWEGRLEDIEIVDGGVSLTAFGYQRALRDMPYTALWSKTGSGGWRAVTVDEASASESERYELDNNNRLYMAPRSGEPYPNNDDWGGLTFATPYLSEREITNFAFDYAMLLPSGWALNIVKYTDAFASPSIMNTTTATGSLQTGSLSLSLGGLPRPRLVAMIRNESGTTSTPTSGTGINYAKLTNIRILTHATPLGSTIAAGLVTFVNGINSTQLSSDTSLINTTDVDMRDELYEDELPSEILDRLALLHAYEWGVYEGRKLHFRAKGSGGREWLVDVTRIINLQRSLENVRNSVYGRYRAADGRVLRTAAANDTDSQNRYGVIRRALVDVQSTSNSEAETHRDTFLSDRADASTRAEIRFSRLYDAAGAEYPLYVLRAGDTVTMRNLAPTLSTAVDRIRTFVVGETEYNAATDEIVIAPEEPTPSLEILVARREADWPVQRGFRRSR